MTGNGNRTEWNPIRSVIIRVITKSDDRAAGVRFVNHEYDYRPNSMTRSDWLIELSDYKLSDNNLASELVGKWEFFKPITFEEIVIFMIKSIIREIVSFLF